MVIDWSRLRQIIDAHDRFLITSHIRPDGDSIGSELGMAAMLAQKGKHFRIVNASVLPPRYRFLSGVDRIEHYGDQVRPEELEPTEVLIILDTSAWQQLGAVADFVRATRAVKVVIDHHLGHDEMGAELFKDVDAAACGAILAEAVEHLGCQLTREVAEPLFVALATDTGWFRFSSTDGRAMRIAARLIEAGLDVNYLYRVLFEESTLARLKLLGRTLEALEVTRGGRVAHSAIRLDDLRNTGAVPQDSEDLVNYTLSIAGVEVGVMFIEQRSGAVKVSFRSKDGLDCTSVARQFGGGGHREAAGATIDAPLPQVETRVLAAVEAALNQRANKS
jgi:phosphoesterase RecJ-like protein